jgi:hypothetical protein
VNTHWKLDYLPESFMLSLKALAAGRRKPRPDVKMPRMAVELGSFTFDLPRLRAYRAICGFPAGDVVPIAFPQVSAISLQMYLLTRPGFPLPLLGLVHLGNVIRQQRPLGEDESFQVSVAVAADRNTDKGIEFDLETRFTDAHGQTVWSAVATVLYRRKKAGRSSSRKPPESGVEGLTEYRTFDAPGDIGRRYGRIAGDMNPIHLYPLTAKLFGFQRHIAHGMWTMARCCALLQEDPGREPSELSTRFKQPLFLPGRVALRCARSGDGFNFALIGRDSGKLHLEGAVR